MEEGKVVISVSAGIWEIEKSLKKRKEKINKAKSSFFYYINKVDNPLARLIKIKREAHKLPISEKEEILLKPLQTLKGL